MHFPIRPRLLARLDHWAERRADTPSILLVRAPAGYGKTGLVRAWLRSRDPAPRTHVVRCAPDSADRFPDDLARELDAAQQPELLVVRGYEAVTTPANDLALAQLHSDHPQLAIIVIASRVRLLDSPVMRGRAAVEVLGPDDLALTDEDLAGYVPAADPRLEAALTRAAGWPLAAQVALGPLAPDASAAPTAARDDDGPDAPGTATPPDGGALDHDPLTALGRFALHHLEIIGDTARKVLFAAALLDSISLESAADFAGASISDARESMYELLELGLVTASPSSEDTVFRCHPAVRPPLAARSTRSSTAAQRRALAVSRAAEIETVAPFTAFTMYCSAGAFAEAELVLAEHFALITDEAEECARLLRSLPEWVPAQHATFAAARLFFDGLDPHASASANQRLIAGMIEAAADRLSNMEREPLDARTEILRVSALSQLMAGHRLSGDVAAAIGRARELEALITGLEAEEPTALDPSETARPGLNVAGVHRRELALTALHAGDFDAARRHWGRLRDHAEHLVDRPWHALHPASTRSVSDLESGRNWLLAALGGLAVTEALDGDLRTAAESLERADRLAESTGASYPGGSGIDAEIARAHLAHEHDDPELLQRALERLEPLRERIEQAPLILLVETEMQFARRGPEAALAQLESALAPLAPLGPAGWGRWEQPALLHLATLRSLAGDYAGSKRLLSRFGDDHPLATIERARLALAASDPAGADALARAVPAGALSKRRRIDRELILALAAWELGDRRESFESLAAAAALVHRYALRSRLRLLPHEPMRELALAARDAGACDIAAHVEDVPAAARVERYGQLTEMERRALETVAGTRTIGEAAEILFVTPGTVKKHLKAVYRKLHASGRDSAVVRARRMGLIPAPAEQDQLPPMIAERSAFVEGPQLR